MYKISVSILKIKSYYNDYYHVYYLCTGLTWTLALLAALLKGAKVVVVA